MKCVHAGCIQDPCYDDAAWHMQLKKEINNMKTNTPTPNEVLTELAGVLHRIPQAHRDIIVTAVNSHEELLRACKAALDMLTNDRAIGVPLQAWLEAAIAKAEGGK